MPPLWDVAIPARPCRVENPPRAAYSSLGDGTHLGIAKREKRCAMLHTFPLLGITGRRLKEEEIISAADRNNPKSTSNCGDGKACRPGSCTRARHARWMRS